MKKTIKWIAIITSFLVAFLVVASIALYLFLPLDKIKDFAALKLSETMQRDVLIEKVSFNIFTGIKLEKVSIGDSRKVAPRPFISADAVALHYDLWPLLSRKVVIKEISLIKPEILIEKSANGAFNFSDLLNPAKPDAKETASPAENPSTSPIDLSIKSFSISSGKITYIDQAAGSRSSINDLNLKVSGFELSMAKPIELSLSANIGYQGKTIPLSLNGRILANLPKNELSISSLSLSVAGESAYLTGNVSSFSSGPSINFTLSSKKLSLDPLLSIFAGQKQAKPRAAKPGELTKTVNQAINSLPKGLSVKGKIALNSLSFQALDVNKIDVALALVGRNATIDIDEIGLYGGKLSGSLSASLVPGLAYSIKNLKLTGFDAHPFSNYVADTFLSTLPDNKEMQDKVYGILNAEVSLSGRGVEPKDILPNLSGKASITLRNGKLKRVKSLAAVGELIRSGALKGDIDFGELDIIAGIARKVVTVDKLKFDQSDFKVNFAGGIDLNKMAWVAGNRLVLKLAPHITSGLSREFSLLKDPSGWLELTMEITGSLKMPIPKPILDKPLEKIKTKIKEKVEAVLASKEAEAKAFIEAEKKKAEEAAAAKVKAESDRLKGEAKEKIKGLIKF